MPNKAYALEWLEISMKNLETARLLFRENHFTDIIAIEIQQSIEKALKAILAFHSKNIPKTHSLPELFEIVNPLIQFRVNATIDDLIEISDYFESERYPGPDYFIPSRSEIEKNFHLAEKIYQEIKNYLNSLC